jgi:stearoyl-CoA desaturase (delta-9 desaturase)
MNRGRLNSWFLIIVHIAALATLGWCLTHPPAWPTIGLGLLWYLCSGLAITGGYHRLFAHGSYRCSPVVSFFCLLFGAAAVQNSALAWASDHRRHHACPDSEDDPYDARRGLWWSHIGWILRSGSARDYSNVRDLTKDRLIMLQHRFYSGAAFFMAAVVPALLGNIWHDALGAFLWAGCVRLVLQYHSTFAINSVAHRFGARPYSSRTSARDNLFVALLTMGEGYHNFHHRFPSDYRNGIRWIDYDPTKWFVYALEAVGLASDLKRTPPQAIARARSGQL